MTPAALPTGALGRVSRAFFLAGAAYWALYALVAPVTNLDSQMYNIARLELALRGGLFNNGFYTSAFQVMWPWTFDAAYLPFLALGWGYALPSFFCLAGTCYVVFSMMRARFGPDAAWVAVTALLGLTCLVYQATSTKNDIPIMFSGAVWIYGRWLWRRQARATHLFWMVLAIGFMAGAKTTGVLYGAILALATLWELRGSRSLLLRAAAGLAAAFALFGSVETYVESARLFGHPLGPPEIIGQLRNRDGLRGGVANLSRYVAGSVYLGPTAYRSANGGLAELIKAEKALLARTGLTDAGADPRFPDNSLFFFQSGFEEISGFGPVGTVAMAAMLLACVCWRPREVWWRLAAAGFLGLALVSLTVAHSDWGNRYLICWYAVATVGAVCALWERETALFKVARWGFAALAMASAVAAPLTSFNRGPAAIAASLRDRDRFETCAYPLIGKVRDRLRELRTEFPRSRLYMVVCNDSVVLPILEDRGLDAILVTPPEFARLAADGQVGAGDLVIEDCRSGHPGLTKIEDVSAPDVFSKNVIRTQAIYRVASSAPPAGPGASRR